MRKSRYLGMRPGDLEGKPYASYWNPDMKPLQDHVQNAVLHGAEAAELGFAMDQVNLLAEAGYLPLENGYTRLGNGQIFVAVLTRMPGVTGGMFEWWMGWHYMEHQRYKLWHPRAHIANGTREMKGDDLHLSDKEKYMTTHLVTEYVGNNRQDITITFVEPDTLFTDPARVAENGTTALICGRVGLQKVPITIGYLVHQIRELETGTEMRSRFWLAKPEFSRLERNHWLNKLLGTKFIAQRISGNSLGRDMLVHCGMEMNHLAGFLPALYADYHQ